MSAYGIAVACLKDQDYGNWISFFPRPIVIFNTRQRTDLGMHSFLNEMNVLMGQLYILGILLRDDENFLEKEICATKRFLAECRLDEDPGWFVRQINPFKQFLLREVSLHVKALPLEDSNEEIELTLETLDKTIAQMMERACQVVHLVRPQPMNSDFLLKDYLDWLFHPGSAEAPAKAHFRSLSDKVPVLWQGVTALDFSKDHHCLGSLIPFLLNHAPAAGRPVELKWNAEPGRHCLLLKSIPRPPVLDPLLEGTFPLLPESDLAGFYLAIEDLKATGFSLQWDSGLDGMEISFYPAP